MIHEWGCWWMGYGPWAMGWWWLEWYGGMQYALMQWHGGVIYHHSITIHHASLSLLHTAVHSRGSRCTRQARSQFYSNLEWWFKDIGGIGQEGYKSSLDHDPRGNSGDLGSGNLGPGASHGQRPNEISKLPKFLSIPKCLVACRVSTSMYCLIESESSRATNLA